MSNEEAKSEKRIITINDDGFEDSSDSDRLLQGTRFVCIDGKWTKPDGTEIPTDKRFLVLGTAEAIQHWQDGTLIKEIIKKIGEPLADIEELNAKIPKDTWEDGINGPRPPWSHVYAAYLLDPADGSVATFLNNTNGAMVAVRELRSRVKWTRALRGSKVLSPIVTLGSRLVSRKYQKYGPDFIVADWRDLSPLPPTTAPRQLEDHTEKEQLSDPVEDIGRPVNEPSMAKILDDKIPEDDWQPPGNPAAKPAPKSSASETRKPAAQKSQMTKRGVQKIAGGRR
jgi:hypothetical protein